jgi:hypothetical protein
MQKAGTLEQGTCLFQRIGLNDLPFFETHAGEKDKTGTDEHQGIGLRYCRDILMC